MPRKTGALLIGLVSAWFVYQLSFLPYRCNSTKKRVETLTLAFFGQRSHRARAVAEKNLRDLKPCLAAFPSDLDLNLAAGANLRILGLFAAATRHYETASRIARRPEIYFNLAEIYAHQRRRKDGFEALYRAAQFDPDVLVDFYDGLLRRQVSARLRADQGDPTLLRRRIEFEAVPPEQPYGQSSTPLGVQLRAGDVLEFAITASGDLAGTRPRLIVIDGSRVLFDAPVAVRTTGKIQLSYRMSESATAARRPLLLWRNDEGASSAVPPVKIDFTYRADPDIEY